MVMKDRFGLYLIAANPVAGFEAVAKAAVDCSVRFLQLRMKNTPREAFIPVARIIRGLTHGSQTRFIVNDDLDAAMEVDADGVHLGQGDMSVAEARRRWNRPDKIFGLSTHSMEQAGLALELQPDYIGVGPVFPTPTKADAEPALGPQETARIMAQSPITSVAIGGIDADTLPSLLQAGIDNYCVVRAVNARPDPLSAIRDLQKIWEKHVF
jgi:thiamine-phosphate pyrophosphorylase